ncbi:hypothetical protein EDC19_2423 [Natranaerovirga hydrolytica]|uniref:Uncharacterized protein n=1 Tax=Natranaerovirga hydrolytica TaxID=680378 RepID=A0A4R1MHP5_9FIRM|nr:hypothetical protein [Natranaerovirga hydrolytica]TCK90654.1 hypothetical protein EDC19_2423 [Natranaerovirga hydrolytica]
MNYRKKTTKIFLISIFVILSLTLSSCNPREKNKVEEDMVDKEIVNQEDIMMNNGFTVGENIDYVTFYYIRSKPPYLKIDPDKDIEFIHGPMLDRSVAVYNFMIWDYTMEDVSEATFTEEYGDKYAQQTLDQLAKMREVCNSYGFTNENRLTSEWVLENQKEALELRQAFIDLKLYWITESMIRLNDSHIKNKE